MANLYISEYSRLGTDAEGNVLPYPLEADIVTEQKVAFTTAAQSAAFAAGTKFIRIFGDAAFWATFSANPTATVASPRYATLTEYFRAVREGDKLSVYDGTS